MKWDGKPTADTNDVALPLMSITSNKHDCLKRDTFAYSSHEWGAESN